MSYNIKITVRSGAASVSTTGEVPDGDWEVSGHDGPAEQFLNVGQRGADGRYVQQAHSVHYKAGA